MSNKPKQLMPREFKFYAILGKALNNYLGPSVLVVEDMVSWQFSTWILIETIVMLDWLFWFTSLRETLNNWRGSNKGPPIWLEMVEWFGTWRKIEEIGFIQPRVEKAQSRTPNHSHWVAKREFQRTYRGCLLTWLQGDRTRGDRHKLLQGKFCLNKRQKFLIMRRFKH